MSLIQGIGLYHHHILPFALVDPSHWTGSGWYLIFNALLEVITFEYVQDSQDIKRRKIKIKQIKTEEWSRVQPFFG